MRHECGLVAALDIAGSPCRIECGDDAFGDFLASRYAGFAPDAAPALTLRVDLIDSPADEVTARWSGPYARVTGDDGVLSISGPGFRGAFDERSDRGWIAQPFDPAPLETFLTAIYAGRLLRESGFLLHAAALVAPEGARVFFGPSGSGKTTVAELIGEGVITDEIVAIRRVGEDWRVSSMPWRGSRLHADAAGLFHLRKAAGTSFARLSPAAALRQMLGSVFFPRADAAEIARFLEIGGELVRTVPCWEMRFTPDRAFWDAIPARALGGIRWSATTTG